MLFQQPRLSSVAALVSREREREREQELRRDADQAAITAGREQLQNARAREEVMAELGLLASETTHLAEALSLCSETASGRDGARGRLSTRGNVETGPSTPAKQTWGARRGAGGAPFRQAAVAHHDHLEAIAAAICQGQSVLCVQLRRVFAKREGVHTQCEHTETANHEFGAEAVHEGDAAGKLSGFPRGQAVARQESTRSRAQTTELMVKLRIKTAMWAQGVPGGGASALARGQKCREQLSTVLTACKTLSNYFEASRTRAWYLSQKEAVLRTAESCSSSSLSSFSEAEIPVEYRTPGRQRGGEAVHRAPMARMFEDDSDEDVEEWRRERDARLEKSDHNEAFKSRPVEQKGLDLSIEVCKTPRDEESFASLIVWIQDQRRISREWNYLMIGAATRIQADWRSFLVQRTFQRMRISCERLQAFVRGALAHRAMAHRIVSWLDSDEHMRTPFSHLKHTAYTTQPLSPVQKRIRNAHMIASTERGSRTTKSSSSMQNLLTGSGSTTAGDSIDEGDDGELTHSFPLAAIQA